MMMRGRRSYGAADDLVKAASKVRRRRRHQQRRMATWHAPVFSHSTPRPAYLHRREHRSGVDRSAGCSRDELRKGIGDCSAHRSGNWNVAYDLAQLAGRQAANRFVLRHRDDIQSQPEPAWSADGARVGEDAIRRFARRSDAANAQRVIVLAAQAADDELFVSLQARAFRG